MLQHLSFRTLGKLLRLAEALKVDRMRGGRSMIEDAHEARLEAREMLSGTYEKATPARDLHLFLQSLAAEEKREVEALFYFGRRAFDDFAAAVANPSLSAEQMPWQLSDKTDLHDSLI